MSPNPPSLPYEEPGIVTILILSSFLLLLNIVNYLLDKLVYCGLIGQILIGVAWGQPGAGWLSREVQDAVMQLGYLGLILVVYEGGLSTHLKTLRANLCLSATVALIGISAPIALSFVLLTLLPITTLQAFAAGAALCSTSLGTTFTVLSTSRLGDSRLGVVLSSAAMMDDVIGLVMVQVISSLGQSKTEFNAVTVVRPVLVSFAFALVVPASCLWIVKPAATWLHVRGMNERFKQMSSRLGGRQVALAMHTLALLALVTGASYAGTSNLFAAYLAGAAISWVSDLVEQLSTTETSARDRTHADYPPGSRQPDDNRQEQMSGMSIYERYYGPAVHAILKPFFFASIGFSIPVTRMFAGQVVWRGFVYAALMTIGKLICGTALVRVPGFRSLLRAGKSKRQRKKTSNKKETRKGAQLRDNDNDLTPHQPGDRDPTTQAAPTGIQANTGSKRKRLPRPRSLYPALMLGSAMVARGEIGFLISSVAESKGIFGAREDSESSDIFLVVTWAILLCTVLGPLSVGLVVRRVRELQHAEREKKTGKPDPLGIWGVMPSAS